MGYGFFCALHGPAWSYCIPCRAQFTFWNAVLEIANIMAKFPAITSCECEHAAHFDSSVATPHTNPGHTYGARFHPFYLTDVKTDFGTFRVCKDCANDCHAP